MDNTTTTPLQKEIIDLSSSTSLHVVLVTTLPKNYLRLGNR